MQEVNCISAVQSDVFCTTAGVKLSRTSGAITDSTILLQPTTLVIQNKMPLTIAAMNQGDPYTVEWG